MEATTTWASILKRSIPTSATRSHASTTIPLSRTRSRISTGWAPRIRSTVTRVPFLTQGHQRRRDLYTRDLGFFDRRSGAGASAEGHRQPRRSGPRRPRPAGDPPRPRRRGRVLRDDRDPGHRPRRANARPARRERARPARDRAARDAGPRAAGAGRAGGNTGRCGAGAPRPDRRRRRQRAGCPRAARSDRGPRGGRRGGAQARARARRASGDAPAAAPRARAAGGARVRERVATSPSLGDKLRDDWNKIRRGFATAGDEIASAIRGFGGR